MERGGEALMAGVDRFCVALFSTLSMVGCAAGWLAMDCGLAPLFVSIAPEGLPLQGY